MIPTKKSEEIEKFLDKTLPHPRRKSIHMDKCTWCGKDITPFRDELSKKEYTISGFCQTCQDETFGR